MPSDIKECSLYSFTLRGQKIKTTPKDITARAAAEAAQTTANGKQDALTTAQLAAVNSGVTAVKVAAWDAIEVPTKTSDLTNDSGFITAAAIPIVPTKTSDLTNDSGFVTSAAIPDSTSDLTNDSGFITASDIPVIPMKTSDLQNDSGFITASDIPAIPSKTSDLTNDSGFITVAAVPDSTSDLTNDSGFITASDIPAIPSKTSELTNDSGFITGYTETDPTVPAWAKASTKPTYTAAEVGALPDTIVIPTVPTDVSAFNNDAGYLTSYTETDPTVPAWAKASSKPTYTAAEVGAQDVLTSAQMDAVNSGITAEKVALLDDIVLTIVKNLGSVTIGSGGYLNIASHIPTTPSGYTFVFAYLYNYGDVSSKTAIAVTGNARYALGTANATITNLRVMYIYVKSSLYSALTQ